MQAPKVDIVAQPALIYMPNPRLHILEPVVILAFHPVAVPLWVHTLATLTTDHLGLVQCGELPSQEPATEAREAPGPL